MRLILLCALYAVAGPAIILLNKYILSDLNFPYPYFLTSLGLICSTAVATALVRGKYVRCVHMDKLTPKFFLTQILPIGVCQALAMGFGTVAYLSLTVAFIQMLKAFTPVITLAVMYGLGVESPSTMVVISVSAISVGTFIAVYGEAQLDMYGLIIHEISAVCEATRLALTQVLLKDMKFSEVEGLFYMAPVGAVSMIVLVIIFELKSIIATSSLGIVVDHWPMFATVSIMGFFLNILSFSIISMSSSVLLKIISVARTAGLVLLCAVFLKETITSLEALGYTLSLAAFVWYNFIKHHESQQAALRKTQAPEVLV
eukprot:m.10387 g.10387  ORF g.10387 m.10387 type:complete len:315 (+) comp8270_c0_seq1:300-1244(+)